MTFEAQTFEEFQSIAAGVDAYLSNLSHRLRQFPRLPNGLTPDDVKQSDEYQTVKKAYDVAFANYRKFNQINVKKFKKEYAEFRKAKRS